MRQYLGTFLIIITMSPYLVGQDCNGGSIATKDSYLYGRFEVAMQSAEGSGIVSAFFLYNINTNCNWPDENNEIDIEMTGNNQLVYFTTHHPHPTQPWSIGNNFNFNFNPHDTIQSYAIEWEPGIIRWFVGGQLVYTQNSAATNNLMYPMAIIMNLWAANAPSWVGNWNNAILPRQARYDYVKYYSYTPGQGNIGTNNNFTFQWQDDFTTLDTSRWNISDFGGFGNNFCTFRKENIEVDSGLLRLTIDIPQPSTIVTPVTFSVNMNEYNLLPSDVVYLNSSFDNWCGSCRQMTENNGIWSITIDLPPGKYEYLFTVNGWQAIGGAPLGSSCDYNPCDQYNNYGLVVPDGNSPISTPTYCWEDCTNCLTTSTIKVESNKTRKLIQIFDLLGREVQEVNNQVLIYLYDDGSVEKKIRFKQN